MSVLTSRTASQIIKKIHESLENFTTLYSEFDIVGDFDFMFDKCTILPSMIL